MARLEVLQGLFGHIEWLKVREKDLIGFVHPDALALSDRRNLCMAVPLQNVLRQSDRVVGKKVAEPRAWLPFGCLSGLVVTGGRARVLPEDGCALASMQYASIKLDTEQMLQKLKV